MGLSSTLITLTPATSSSGSTVYVGNASSAVPVQFGWVPTITTTTGTATITPGYTVPGYVYDSATGAVKQATSYTCPLCGNTVLLEAHPEHKVTIRGNMNEPVWESCGECFGEAIRALVGEREMQKRYNLLMLAFRGVMRMLCKSATKIAMKRYGKLLEG